MIHKIFNIGLQDSDINDIINIIRKNEKIDKIILFGSRAKQTYEKGSDIDIAISGNGLNTNDILDLSNALDDLDLPYKFDLVILERINEKELLDHIFRKGIVLYNKNKPGN